MKHTEQNSEIYETAFVECLFDSMSKTYSTTNYISSFGFSERWRKQCIQQIKWHPKLKVGYDFMSGTGENWRHILKRGRKGIKIISVDNSKEMNRKARNKLKKHSNWNITVLEANILNNTISNESADFIVSSFGLKTFSENQLEKLASEMARIIKPGGQIALTEISVPNNQFLKQLYLFYLKYIIPIIGKLFAGNSTDYRMLGIYTVNFQNCHAFQKKLEAAGFNTELSCFFYGCATGIKGHKKCT